MNRRWPTLRERLPRQDDVLDESYLRVRPTPDEIEALGDKAEAILAERRTATERAAAASPTDELEPHPRRLADGR
jgi:hypothetical protein